MSVIARVRSALKRNRNFSPEEAYLNEATSMVDLEIRQRQIDTGKFQRRLHWPY